MDISGVVLEQKPDAVKEFVSKLLDTTTTLSVPIDAKVLDVLQEILRVCPTAFPSFLEPILARGKLEVSDIPSLVLQVAQLRNAHFPTITMDSVLTLIKISIHALVDLKYVNIQDNKEAVLSMFDASILLLQATIAPTVKITCCWK